MPVVLAKVSCSQLNRGDATQADRNRACHQIHRLARALNVAPEVTGEAEGVYRLLGGLGLTKRKSDAAVAVASLFAAARLTGEPITLRELITAAVAEPWRRPVKKEVTKIYRALFDTGVFRPLPAETSSYVRRIAASLRMDEVSENAMKIYRWALTVAQGRQPMVVGAASLYLACMLLGMRVTEKDVADAAGVSEASVRSCIRTLLKEMGQSNRSDKQSHGYN